MGTWQRWDGQDVSRDVPLTCYSYGGGGGILGEMGGEAWEAGGGVWRNARPCMNPCEGSFHLLEERLDRDRLSVVWSREKETVFGNTTAARIPPPWQKKE